MVYYSLLFIVYYLYYILFQKGLKEAGLLQYNLTECQVELLRLSLRDTDLGDSSGRLQVIWGQEGY